MQQGPPAELCWAALGRAGQPDNTKSLLLPLLAQGLFEEAAKTYSKSNSATTATAIATTSRDSDSLSLSSMDLEEFTRAALRDGGSGDYWDLAAVPLQANGVLSRGAAPLPPQQQKQPAGRPPSGKPARVPRARPGSASKQVGGGMGSMRQEIDSW